MVKCLFHKPKRKFPDICDDAVYLEGQYPRKILCSSDKLDFWFCPFFTKYPITTPYRSPRFTIFEIIRILSKLKKGKV